MATVKSIYNCIDSFAPFRTQESWDNSGILVGDADMCVDRVLLALDATCDVADEAEKLGCRLVITHHPVIFDPLKSLNSDIPACRLLIKGIACISAHTNLDSAEFGISDMMCDRLGLKNCHIPIEINRVDSVNGRKVGYGTVGELENEMTAVDFAKMVKERFGCDAIAYTANAQKNIKRVGLFSGAGGEGVFSAIEMGLDAFVTAEVKHHQFLEAARAGLTVIDAGHYYTEVIALDYLKEKLSESIPETEFIISKSPFCVYHC